MGWIDRCIRFEYNMMCCYCWGWQLLTTVAGRDGDVVVICLLLLAMIDV